MLEQDENQVASRRHNMAKEQGQGQISTHLLSKYIYHTSPNYKSLELDRKYCSSLQSTTVEHCR